MTEDPFHEIHSFPALVAILGVGLVFYMLRISQFMSFSLNATTAALLLLLSFFFLPQTVLVDEKAVHVQFGWLSLNRRTIPLEQITGSKAINYLLPGDAWALQLDPTSTPSFIPGAGRMLVLYLKNGSTYLVNSPRIEELQRAIEAGRQRHGNAKQVGSE
ncbi:MAG: hypothetical protein WD688_10375 [Candidatus Binatia bacterium]